MSWEQQGKSAKGDDVYSAFDDQGQQDFFGTMSAQQAVNPLAGRKPPPSQWGAPPGTSQKPGSQWGGRPDARPMTSNRASGFGAAHGGFDAFNQRGNTAMQLGPAAPLQRRSENSPEEQCNEMDRQVNILVEESAQKALEGDFSSALEKAKEAGKKERQLCKQREQLGLGDQINVDLTYAVHFNLAVMYHRNGLYTEALNTYSLIVRNKQYAQSGRLRVNMGNIYAEQKKYLLAIKMYRISLDEIPASDKALRYKIMRNIGNAFVKMGQYKDAIGSYEAVMDGESGEINTGFNLLLCYYALGDVEKLKRTFSKLLTIKVAGYSPDEEEEDDKAKEDVLHSDALRKEVRERRRKYLHTVTTAARLIAPMLDKDWRIGFDYVIEQLRHYEIKDATAHLASELEMCKGLNYLKYKKYKEAIDCLKSFEKKDKVLRARAATNLSYLYFLEGDFDSGEKYADLSVDADRYNCKALVNKGNFMYVRGEWEKAKQFYESAINVESDCVEAIYNLALANKQMGLYEEALRVFKRVQSIIDSVEVVYQIADLFDIMNDPRAPEWFHRLIGRVPTDPNVLARLGLLNAKEGDESQAFHYYLEAYRYYQVNMDVISWLGAYFVKNEVYDKAMQFFERAAQIQPQEVKWQLMVASCHRRRGEYPQAKRMYEDIHRRNPDNIECLRYLVHLCKDSGLVDEANEWFKKFKRLESKLDTDRGSLANELGATTSSDPGVRPSSDTPVSNSPKSEAPAESRSAARRRNNDEQKRAARDSDDDVDLPGT
jgi:intraflagellar transport protein 88